MRLRIILIAGPEKIIHYSSLKNLTVRAVTLLVKDHLKVQLGLHKKACHRFLSLHLSCRSREKWVNLQIDEMELCFRSLSQIPTPIILLFFLLSCFSFNTSGVCIYFFPYEFSWFWILFLPTNLIVLRVLINCRDLINFRGNGLNLIINKFRSLGDLMHTFTGFILVI